MRTQETEVTNFSTSNSREDDTQRFFNYLDPKADEFEFRVIWPINKGKPPEGQQLVANIRGTPDNLASILQRSNEQGYGIFVTVNETDGEGVKASNVVRIRTVFADFDDGIPGRFPLTPSMIVQTSPGKCQCYWLVDDDMAPSQFDGIMSCLVETYGADKNAKDIARVLRIPGFDHTKADPFPVRLTSPLSGKEITRYQTRTLIDAFPAPAAKSRSSKPSKLDRLGSIIGGVAFDATRARNALSFIPSGDREIWIKIGMALHHETNGSDEALQIFHEWSQRSAKYNEQDTDAKWKSFAAGHYNGDLISIGTLYKLAADHGYVSPSRNIESLPKAPPEIKDGITAIAWATDMAKAKGPGDGWSKDEQAELLTRMAKDHAKVDYGGKVLWTKREIDAFENENIVFMSGDAMRAKYSAITVGGSLFRPVTAFDLLNRSPTHTQYEGVGFFPGSTVRPAKVPPAYLNLFGGLRVTPRKGDWSLVQTHMRDVICQGNEAHYEWWLDWNAQLIQEPQRKPGAALVLRSSQKGTGKSMFGVFWQKIFGRHVGIITSPDQITGRFNAAISESLLLLLEEASWGGSHAAGNVLKERITGQTTMLERKGLDPIMQPNYTRFWFNTNEQWSVPVGTDERRYFCLDFEFQRARDKAYFDPIFRQMLDNGGVEAMTHELLDRKITSDLFNPPVTPGLLLQRELGLTGVDRFLLEIAQDGFVPREHGGRQELKSGESTAVSTNDVQAAAKPHCTDWEARQLPTRLGLALAKVGVRKSRSSQVGVRGYVYTFPPLGELRELAGRHLGLKIAPLSQAAVFEE